MIQVPIDGQVPGQVNVVKKSGTIIGTPAINTNYNSNQGMTLRDQLYSVKNSMQTKFQFSQVNLNSRGQALQSPRPVGASS